VTHVKRLNIKKGAMTSFEEFLEKISLKNGKQIGCDIIPAPSSFTVSEFKNNEQFLDRLPTANDYEYAMEFRHPSWET
jgi:uncharacterized protein YecE (DUF72 family)